MNKSPERTPAADVRPESIDDRTFLDLASESRIQSGEKLANDRELTADRTLKDELGALEAPPLPPELRARVLSQTKWRRGPASWIALAAVVVLSVVLVIALDQEPPDPAAHFQSTNFQSISARDWMDLKLALETLDASGRRVAEVTEQEIRPHLVRPVGPLNIELPSVPTLESLLRRFESTLQPSR